MKILDSQVDENFAVVSVLGDSGNVYTVCIDAIDMGDSDCGCPAYYYGKKPMICKHMDYALDYLSLVFDGWLEKVNKIREVIDRWSKKE